MEPDRQAAAPRLRNEELCVGHQFDPSIFSRYLSTRGSEDGRSERDGPGDVRCDAQHGTTTRQIAPRQRCLEAPMGCCDETTARVPDRSVSRRSLFKGAALVASVVPTARPTRAATQGKQIKLAYCSQLLCGVPYEVARSAGYFKNHGLDVQLVYTRGGNAAMQALVGVAVDYGATSLDVAIQAYANVGADIRRFAVTGRLPLFAVVTAPKTASQIQSIKDLEGRTVGISALGNADHALTLYLLKQAGADAQKVKFATMGVNLLEALRQGQIDVGVVQEPALTLLQRSGARVLMNGMELADAQKYFGGSYEFMGVAVRGKEFAERKPE